MITKFIAFFINTALLFAAVVGFPFLTILVQDMDLWLQGVIVIGVIAAFIILVTLTEVFLFSAKNWDFLKSLYRQK